MHLPAVGSCPVCPPGESCIPRSPLEVIGTDSVLDLSAGDADVAIRYATGRIAPDGWHRRGTPERYLLARLQSSIAFIGAAEAAADLKKHVLVHSYWSAVRSRAAHMAEMARLGAAQVAGCAGFQGHAAPELSRGAARNRGGHRRSGNWRFQRRAGGTRARCRNTRESIRPEPARLSLLCRPQADHPREKITQAFSAWLRSAG